MNLHLMIIMLGFTQPTFTQEPLQLLEAPQVVAPMTLWEDKATLKEMRYKQEVLKVLQQQALKTYIYFGKDKRWHAVYSEVC